MCSRQIDSHPPTHQTQGSIWLKFFMQAPLVNLWRGTEGIFWFHARSRDKGPNYGFLVWAHLGQKIWIFRLPERNSKIPSVPLNRYPRGASMQNLTQIDSCVWSVGGVLSIWLLHILYYGHICNTDWMGDCWPFKTFNMFKSDTWTALGISKVILR